MKLRYWHGVLITEEEYQDLMRRKANGEDIED